MIRENPAKEGKYFTKRKKIWYNRHMEREILAEGLFVWQDPALYRFTEDAIRLAEFAQSAYGRVCDLCAGSGVIGLLLSRLSAVRRVDLVELQKGLCRLAVRSVADSNLEGRVFVHETDLAKAPEELGRESMDCVLCNPPYRPAGEAPARPEIALCRCEVAMDLSGLVRAAGQLLKYGGKFFVSYPSDRLCELICRLHEGGLEPKRIRPLTATRDKSPDAVLVEAKKGARPGTILEPARIRKQKEGKVDLSF